MLLECFLYAIPVWFLLYCCYMLQYTKITTSKLNWTETHTILPIFLGSTQEARRKHTRVLCVLPACFLLLHHLWVAVYIYTVDEIFFSWTGWQNHLRQVLNQQTLTLVTNKSWNKQLAGALEALWTYPGVPGGDKPTYELGLICSKLWDKEVSRR